MLVKRVSLLNHISKISASNTDLAFLNETIKKLIANNKINDNSLKINYWGTQKRRSYSIHWWSTDFNYWWIIWDSRQEPHCTSIGRWKRIRNTNNSHYSHLKKKKQNIWTKASLKTCHRFSRNWPHKTKLQWMSWSIDFK